ncbi:DUF3784 domain-containing protein [Virgibacillus sp. MSJ-26]|uniref:DUF3784 domain-containing protein n=1 Tax=Virgibacillus sp. MSJ-26 TaxID=2841522 RepID=UPI001C0F93CD|nr:DUF3784 domain-containing protein [Virgibacillus sp. MSJ-26]MBU5465931.1 DUF3784 domain-containing protein [Virgibacillus sp. MSJ-26]
MDKGKLIYILTMGWTLVIYGGLTYLFAKKKDYMLLSGFHRRPEEEQEYLQKSGYLDAMGKLLTITFWIFVAVFILGLLPIPYGFELGIGIFLIALLGGMVWVQRYEVPHKRKKKTWITASISGASLLFIIGAIGYGYLDNDVQVNHDTFEITGSYGVEWKIDTIESVKLLDALPKVKMKTNGFAPGNLLKGKFRLEEPYGTGRLFIDKKADTPVLYVATQDDYVMINRKNKNDIDDMYRKLIESIEY